MIENDRDEVFCRPMDVLADEYHTHHLTPEEYYYYQSNWWLRSNKTILCECSVDLTSNKHRPPCCNCKRRRSSTKSTMGTEFFFLMVELARFMEDSFFSLCKTPWRWTKFFENRVTCKTCIWKQFFRAFSWIHLLCYRWIVYSWRRSTVTDGVCKYHYSIDVFSRCKMCSHMEKWWWIETTWQQDENLDTKCKIQKWKPRIVYGLLTQFNEDANDNISAFVTFHDTNVNNNIYACVASHDAYTCNRIHWASCAFS